jgi:putative exporter of polyketide antibiotics
MSPRTIFISRMLGLYCLIASLIMFTHKSAMVEIENTLVHNPAMLFLGGVITLVAGLAIVLSHNVWSGGALSVTVTLLGWISLIKGVLLLSPGTTSGFWDSFQYERFFYLYASISFVLGAYLTYGGFRTQRTKPHLGLRHAA